MKDFHPKEAQEILYSMVFLFLDYQCLVLVASVGSNLPD